MRGNIARWSTIEVIFSLTFPLYLHPWASTHSQASQRENEETEWQTMKTTIGEVHNIALLLNISVMVLQGIATHLIFNFPGGNSAFPIPQSSWNMQTHRSDHKILNPTFPLVVISTVSYCYVTLALLLAVKMETSKNMWMCSGELEVCREISLNTFKGYTLDKGYLGVESILFNGPLTKTTL